MKKQQKKPKRRPAISLRSIDKRLTVVERRLRILTDRYDVAHLRLQ